MQRIQVRSFIRIGSDFLPIQDIKRYEGDRQYVPGAVSLVIDGIELLGTDLWDDVNWLWPFIVQALDDCRNTGFGKRGFPDQPISFKAEKARAANTRITVTGGTSINRTAVSSDDQLYETVARAGVEFFAHLNRVCPGSDIGEEERATLESWLASKRDSG